MRKFAFLFSTGNVLRRICNLFFNINDIIKLFCMNLKMIAAGFSLMLLASCAMDQNPLLEESSLPYGAPQFDKIKVEHYLPAFQEGIKQAKADVDAIVSNREAPTFENTIVALEYSGELLNKVAGIFYNVNEACTSPEMQNVAEQLAPMMTEYSLYVSLNEKLFERIKSVYDQKDSLNLTPEQLQLLKKTYDSFARNGANLSADKKAEYGKLSEELSLTGLKFAKNSLDATNAYTLHITDESQLAGLPEYVREMAASEAAERNMDGWVFTLSSTSLSSFLKFSEIRDLRKEIWMASNTKAIGGQFDNCGNVRQIVELETRIANLLGYETYADYALVDRMAKNKETVNSFLDDLVEKTLPFARKDVDEVKKYAKENGFTEEMMPWDFSYWSEKYQEAKYSLNEELLKPYFQLDTVVNAAFDLAGRLYGLTFEERKDLPVYHPDVKVYDVKDGDRHMALLYMDFFPRDSKRSGAWMTAYREQSIRDGVELRPFINVVTNFTKPTANTPSLLTHYEVTTLLHEFGHALHGILAEGTYPSISGTSVPRDFVELPSQIMENWAYEPEFLNLFAKHYKTGEPIPMDLIEKIIASKNYLSGYAQLRQLQFGVLDMAWYTTVPVAEDVVAFEQKAVADLSVLPQIPGTAMSTSFGHIFAGGYAAGYYSYKWAEVLEADAFSLFKEKGIFNKEVAASFRENILSKGSSVDADVMYRNFRGRDPQADALMIKLGLK